MKKLLILGGGTAGSIMANKMYKKLPSDQWSITVVDREVNHFYQPGFLFIPFGYYKRKDIVKPTKKFFPAGVELIMDDIEKINTADNSITLKKGGSLA